MSAPIIAGLIVIGGASGLVAAVFALAKREERLKAKDTAKPAN